MRKNEVYSQEAMEIFRSMSRLQAVQDSWIDQFIGSSKEGIGKMKPHVRKRTKLSTASLNYFTWTSLIIQRP